MMGSLWKNHFYYLFGFMFLAFGILCVTCSEVSIVITYYTLCHGNYKWWWRSFFVCASSGAYLFIFSLAYGIFVLNLSKMASFLLYMGYMTMASLFLAMFSGTVGFLASFLFTRKIYMYVKID